MQEVVIRSEYNQYPDIISISESNPIIQSPYAVEELQMYQTRESLMDVDVFRNFIKNAERRFRSSRHYKAYKAYLIESLGINRCQIFGNITTEDADVELHHNVLNLFDICLMITQHTVNTIGMISTFDLIQLLIQEHWNNNVGVTFLSKTAHQVYTNDNDGFIPPDMTFGAWWNLLYKYKYGITFNIANKVIKYIKKYQDGIPVSIDLQHQNEILNFAYLNEYGMPKEDCGYITVDDDYSEEDYAY